LPSAGGERTGMLCAGIVSQRVSRATLHFNVALARSREQWERSFGVIAEGLRFGAVEPVFEALVGSMSDGVRTRTAKVGATRVSEIRLA